MPSSYHSEKMLWNALDQDTVPTLVTLLKVEGIVQEGYSPHMVVGKSKRASCVAIFVLRIEVCPLCVCWCCAGMCMMHVSRHVLVCLCVCMCGSVNIYVLHEAI